MGVVIRAAGSAPSGVQAGTVVTVAGTGGGNGGPAGRTQTVPDLRPTGAEGGEGGAFPLCPLRFMRVQISATAVLPIARTCFR